MRGFGDANQMFFFSIRSSTTEVCFAVIWRRFCHMPLRTAKRIARSLIDVLNVKTMLPVALVGWAHI